MDRPELTRSLSATEFLRWYWLKAEMQAFCRTHGLSPSGSKTELTNRIANALSGREVGPAPQRRSRNLMPSEFTPETVIAAGWRCTESLRAYFKSVHGPGFSFNAALREIIANGQGKTLAEASAVYAATRGKPAEAIEGQFEYNRHMREFHARNPGASHQQAVEAWWAKRSKAEG